jgi:hypothetical protein
LTERRRPGQRRTLIVSLRDSEGCSRLRPRPTFMATYRASARIIAAGQYGGSGLTGDHRCREPLADPEARGLARPPSRHPPGRPVATPGQGKPTPQQPTPAPTSADDARCQPPAAGFCFRAGQPAVRSPRPTTTPYHHAVRPCPAGRGARGAGEAEEVGHFIEEFFSGYAICDDSELRRRRSVDRSAVCTATN